MSAESNFEAELSRTVGPTQAAALVEFFRLNKKQQWLIVNGQVLQIEEAEIDRHCEDDSRWNIDVATKEDVSG